MNKNDFIHLKWNLVYALGVIVLTWVYTFYLEQKYRTDDNQNKQSKKLPRSEVIQKVVLNQFIQTSIFLIFAENPQQLDKSQVEHTRSFVQEIIHSGLCIIVAMLIIDTWQYWMHRLAHVWKYVYHKIHSVHHAFVIPRPIGGFYNDLLESLIMDGGSFAIAQFCTGMSPLVGAILGLFANLKTIHDHLGVDVLMADDWMQFWSYISSNNYKYHKLHHQLQKGNFQQPFFTFWDDWCDTRLQ